MEIVAAPKVEQAKFGLLSLPRVEETSDRWESGYTYESDQCTADVFISDVCGADGVRAQIVDGEPCDTSEYEPFVIEVEDNRSTFGFAAEDRVALALEKLDMCTQKAVEHELWTGELSTLGTYDNKFLASNDAVDVTPGASAVSPRLGIALLERALGDSKCGVRGVIHATRDVVSLTDELVEVDGHLETPLGNYVVAGVGYTGVGPGGVAPAANSVWLYATGPVAVRLGEGFVSNTQMNQRVNVSNNTVGTLATRIAAVDFSGCAHFAVLVDLTLA